MVKKIKKLLISQEEFDKKFCYGNKEFITAYLRDSIKEFNKTGNIDVFLMNLRILAIAGGVTQLSKKAEIKRPNIYRILRPNYQPKFSTILNISRCLGINLYCC